MFYASSNQPFIPFSKQTISLLLLLTYSLLSFGQASSTSSVVGTLRDASGAIVADGAVKLTSLSTAATWSTTSDSEGRFAFPVLPPGSYKLVAQSANLKAELSSISLQVSDRLSITVPMQVAQRQEAIVVESEATFVQESPTVGMVVGRQLLENLPLNGRSLQSLISLAPGVVPVAANLSALGQFSVNGQRDSSNYFTVDGVSANLGVSATTGLSGGSGYSPAWNAQGGTNSMVSVDALLEFRIQTSTFAPEYGRTPGAQVSMVTRPGTNSFHGSLFEYFRNDKLDANDWFANSNNLGRAALRQNQFGGVFGGPVIKNKTFFFGSYEGLRLRQPQAGINVIVPSQSIRNTTTGALNDFVKAFPLPNGPDLGNGTATFSGAYSNPSTSDVWSLRIDHHFNDRWNLFGRYNDSDSDSGTRVRLSPAVLTTTTQRFQSATAGLTWVASPTVTNDLRVNWSRNQAPRGNEITDFGGAVPIPSTSALFSPYAAVDNTEFSFRVGSAGINLGRPTRMKMQQFNLVDTATAIIGAHQLKIGGDYRLLTPTFDYASFVDFTNFRNFADALAGKTNYIYMARVAGPLHPRIYNLSLFAQDTWRVTNRLTLTYGLRWELNPAPTERDDRGVPVVLDLNDPSAIRLAPAGTPAYRTRYNNFAPRAGVAYRVSDSSSFTTVIRGGFGVFYDTASDQAFLAYDGYNYPFTASVTMYNASWPFPSDQRVPPPISYEPEMYSNLSVFDRNLKSPYTLHWNVTAEQSIGRNQTLSVGYIGAAGRRLYRSLTYPKPGVNFENLRVTQSDAKSDYNALQVQFQRRFAKNLQAIASYTWSHSIDTLSNQNLINFQGQNPNDDRASSDWDRRQAFTAAVNWDLPYTKAKASFVNALTRNWGIDTTFRALSSAPIPVMIWTNSLYPPYRPNIVPGQPFWIDSDTLPGGRRINPAAFSAPPENTQGNAPRNFLNGFPLSQLDFALRRSFSLSEALRLQFRAEAFNILNQPNFADPNGTSYAYNFDSTYGLSTQMLNRSLGGLNQLYQIGGPRSIQLGLKLTF